MSEITINGKDVDTKLLEELKENIKTNNDIVGKQNTLLVRYIRYLVVLAILMSALVPGQLILMFVK